MSSRAECADDFAVRLGRRIERLRRAQRPAMPLELLATRIGASTDFVSKVERGEADLPLSLAERMARVFGITVAELAGDRDRACDAWLRAAMQTCRVFAGPDPSAEEASGAVACLANLIASYQRAAPEARKRRVNRARRVSTRIAPPLPAPILEGRPVAAVRVPAR